MHKTKDDYPIVLTVSEVMEILRIGKRVAYELMNQKDFPTIKIGKLKRVNRDAFFDWLQRKGLES
ncbi:helix-turn-helix domain-containing protein [Neobacillus jeddahensis]|uniref:helix-turn-helix domain-containing protein n=1 Tax=Neobacillus jeddahensis TaxID=1461580 RepID=UPI0005A70619|nr:helix-turn-helix domain-containing protein [Neobacillus jeddahensis]